MKIAPTKEALFDAVKFAQRIEHGVGYTKRRLHPCNLSKVHGCFFCRTLAGLENK